MKIKGLVALAATGVAASGAAGDVVGITSAGLGGLEGNGAFTGTISYVPGTLVVTLTNEMASNPGGTITGFVFNIAGDATATLTMASHPFENLAPGHNASPFGSFEAGAALNGTWSGGGSPAPGIARGASGTFTFDVTGPGAAGLTASSFVGVAPDVQFAVRFRGFANGGSDKTPGFLVPAPGALAVVGVGLMASARRRR